MTNEAPIFPPELEREIFETAATIHPTSIRTLLLVAKRTLEWQVPLQYRMVRIKVTADILGILRLVEEKPLVLRNGVRFLCFDNTNFLQSDGMGKLLATCTKIVDIGITKAVACPQLLPLLAAMPQLRRFAGAVGALFGNAQGLFNDDSFLRNITHLDLFDNGSSVIETIMRIPSLTHLSFSNPSSPSWNSIEEILAQCGSLVVLLLWPRWAAKRHRGGGWMSTMAARDVRFVVGAYRDGQGAWRAWENHALTGAEDDWDRAEDFVRRKRNGEVDGVSCLAYARFVFRNN
ncbi:hypothetical protein C8F01DRAFT_1370347 [Mycena amicta]|nr:hypothetical protein C8F01DRAFT_1370347 [Mycena amicta]